MTTGALWVIAWLTFEIVTAMLFHKYVGWGWLPL